MKYFWRALFLLIVLGILGGGYSSRRSIVAYWKERNRIHFRSVETDRGSIVAVVNSTGTVKPVLQVTVGSFVSGPIEELFVEFNQQVEKGDVLAEIDPRIYEAAVARDRANLATRMAEVERIKAELQRAMNEEERARRLLAESSGYLSDSEIDQIHFNRLSLAAQLKIAEAAIDEAEANLETSQANLEYCSIRAPVAGTIIDRKIDPGQTLAAQFQTPELFVIAPDMQKEMHVFASVDEADIGFIRAAQEAGNQVQFTVDAYPDELFSGTIWQVRQSSTVVQNVVTYPVIVAAPNADLKLLPGMTANLSFEIESRSDVLRVPNAALRFYPERAWVHPDDYPVLDGEPSDRQQDNAVDQIPADKSAEAVVNASKRHVWVEDQGLLRAVEVTTGISDYRHTEILTGSLQPGQKLITGLALTD